MGLVLAIIPVAMVTGRCWGFIKVSRCFNHVANQCSGLKGDDEVTFLALVITLKNAYRQFIKGNEIRGVCC